MRRAETFGRSCMIFDMDGTLVDSMPAWKKGIGDTALERGVVLPDTFYGFIKNLPAQQAAEYLVEHYLPGEDPLVVWRRFAAIVREQYETTVELKPHARELLEAYRAQGITMALLTGTDREMIDLVLDRLDLARYFAGSWSCREAGGAKATTVPFDFVLDRLGKTRRDAVVFEDGIHGAATAAGNGMVAVGVYDATSREEIEEFKKIVHRYVRSLDELFV